ncbi:MAG: hypothetical protein OEX02_10405 [Cyclobacteriaceae bacterium]|nr:hypothetical protein [Cyclobacteriaceae bacterium]
MIRYGWICLIFSLSFCQSPEREKRPVRVKREREAFAIMRQDDCFICHGIYDNGGGPAYIRIAEHYETTNENIRMLSRKVLEGGGGVWGGQQMVRHNFIKPGEAESIVKWVLSLDADSVEKRSPINAPFVTIQPDSSQRFTLWLNDNHFAGSAEAVHFNDLSFRSLPTITNPLTIKHQIMIERRGKYFYKLAGKARLYIDGNQVISDREDDREIMLEMEEGIHTLRVEYEMQAKNNLLSLHWLPLGDSYYKLMK